MKKYIILLLLILMGTSLYLIYKNTQKKDRGENVPLSEFMLGKWKGEITVNNGTMIYVTKYQLEFVNESKFELCNEYLNNYGCGEYTYQAISDNMFEVESKRTSGKWKISRDGNNLLVCMNTNSIDKDICIPFSRDDSWW